MIAVKTYMVLSLLRCVFDSDGLHAVGSRGVGGDCVHHLHRLCKCMARLLSYNDDDDDGDDDGDDDDDGGGDDDDNNNNKAQNLVRGGCFKRTHAQYWFVLQ